MDVFSSKREKESYDLQKVVDRVYKGYEKYNDSVLNEIGNNEDVWIFLGAGISGDLINKIENENK